MDLSANNGYSTNHPKSSPEVWGGFECTINRVGEQYLDQLEFSKLYDDPSRIRLLGELGIKKLRFPVLWERYHNATEDRWSWLSERLEELRQFSISPIAGLVHHGSGPRHTRLDSSGFAEGLRNFAATVARKFPWIEYYTPVNEPLTTARFSGLYGLWYPHLASDHSFCRMLLNEIKGVVLAMGEVRKINPDAKLIQTEDLGKTYATPYLQYQANFENERRWLTFDLLCGKFDSDHPLWDYFLRSGITEKELSFFLDNPCPPDIAGFNHYVTSERFLDDDLQRYPRSMHGGNGMERYVDTEAVRVNHGQPSGLKLLLTEAYERFNIPMAITEVHLNCTREEQMRWLQECFETCSQLDAQGIPVRAVTPWSLFGAHGWNKLLTSKNVDYEAGAFDCRSDQPRPTALVKLIQNISKGTAYKHPVLMEEGWWHKEWRYFPHQQNQPRQVRPLKKNVPPVLIVGRRGTLGAAFGRICEGRSIPYRLLGRDEIEICNSESITRAIDKYKPWAVINAAGYVRVDDAEDDIDKCFADNARGPENLANVCSRLGIKLMTYSSDLVFDGKKLSPYTESDATSPLNVYGRSKAEKENRVLAVDPASLIIRTSAFFGPWDQYNFVYSVIDTIRSGKNFYAVDDVVVSPTYVPDLVHASLDLLIDDERGIWHLANKSEITWADLAEESVRRAKLNTGKVIRRSACDMGWRAARPLYSALTSERGQLLPTLDNSLHRFFSSPESRKVLQSVE
jgi:dTDP-4-dehydrorhamnose reductase